MLKEVFSDYIVSNMAERGWKLKDTAQASTLSDSTINSYILKKVNNPSETNMLLVIKGFGHSPDVLHQLRREASLSSETGEKKLLGAADDEERMKLFTSAVRTTVAQTLEEYRLQSAAQQTEIIQNADARVETERQRFKARADEVLRQCNEEVARVKESCNERIKMMEAHNNQRIADIREHMNDLIAEKTKAETKTAKQHRRTSNYLRSSVRNLCIAVGLLVITNVFFGAYAIFSYTTFDMADPTRGLHRETHSVGPMMLFLSIVLIGIACVMIALFLVKRHQDHKERYEDD